MLNAQAMAVGCLGLKSPEADLEPRIWVQHPRSPMGKWSTDELKEKSQLSLCPSPRDALLLVTRRSWEGPRQRGDPPTPKASQLGGGGELGTGQLQENGGRGTQGWVHSVCSKWGSAGWWERRAAPKEEEQGHEAKGRQGAHSLPIKALYPPGRASVPQLCLSWFWNYPH